MLFDIFRFITPITLRRGVFFQKNARFIASRHSIDRKSTRLNSSHSQISYAVFCLKKKKKVHALRHKVRNSSLLILCAAPLIPILIHSGSAPAQTEQFGNALRTARSITVASFAVL